MSAQKDCCRLTPGSQPWAAAVIRDLREGYGVEDIALRLFCSVEVVREKVANLRRLGLMPQLYEQARKGWR
jgi:DNA-binding NarL/FixJ family response regulator